MRPVAGVVGLRGGVGGGGEEGVVAVEFLEDAEREGAGVVLEAVEGGGLGGGRGTSGAVLRAVLIIVRMPATIYLFIMSLGAMRCTFSARACSSFWQFLPSSSLFIMQTMRPSSGS